MEKLKVKIKVLENGTLPTKAHKEDACYDLYARDISTFKTKTGELRIVYHCGITTEIPVGYEAVVRPRSSIRKYDMVMPNSPGTIDSGYRGEWLVTMMPTVSMRKKELELLHSEGITPEGMYNKGDRVAQFCIKKVIDFDFKQEVKKLAKSERASKGHGASGE